MNVLKNVRFVEEEHLGQIIQNWVFFVVTLKINNYGKSFNYNKSD